MRQLALLIFGILILASTGLSVQGKSSDDTGVFANSTGNRMPLVEDDDDIIDLWDALNKGVEEESQEGDEEFAEEEESGEETPEEQPENENDGSNSQQGSDQTSTPFPTDDWVDWSSIEGEKVPFFFLMDLESDELYDDYEPKIAKLKALKVADQIINGIPFKINSSTKEVYLTENMTSMPEYVHLVERIDYAGVARFDYEVLLPVGGMEKMTSGRQVRSAAQIPASTIAASFEASRRQALTEGVRKAFIKEKVTSDSNAKTEYTGKITGYQILNEGWLNETERFYLEMSVWVEFDL